MSDTSGPTSQMPFAYYDPDSQSLRTSQGTLPWDSTPSSPILPRWGSMRTGALYRRQRPAHRTAVSGSSSLLPTPAVNDMGRGKTVEDWGAWTDAMRARHGNGNGHGKSLEIEAQRLLPTPKASDGPNGGPGMRNGRGVADALPGVVTQLLPTPTAQAAKHGSTPDIHANGYGSNLWDLPTLLPTPTSDHKDQYVDNAGSHRPGDTDNVPRAVREMGTDFGPYAAAIARWETVTGRPAPSPTEPGANGRPRLSPRFAEWMMGLPDGWVTGVGIPRSAQLKALGNGVVPQQAALALAMLDGDGAAVPPKTVKGLR